MKRLDSFVRWMIATLLALLALSQVVQLFEKPQKKTAGSEATASATGRWDDPTLCEALARFYQGQPTDPKLLCQVTDYAEEAAVALCVEDQVSTILAMIHRESYFIPTVTGDPGEDSHGITQVRKRYDRKLRKAWSRLGYDLGTRAEIRTQVFFGVMVFRDKLAAAKGDLWTAVRSYNGRGQRAERYAARVFFSRARIFGRPYTKGERTDLYLSCKEN